MRLSKELLLDATDRGRDFFEKVLDGLNPAGDIRFENISSPFRLDKNPSFSVYLNVDFEKWMFKDFGDPDLHGDMFDFAALHYDLDVKEDFYKVMELIAEEMQIDVADISSHLEEDKQEAGWATGFQLEFTGEAFGIEEAYDYFKQFGITKDILREYQVKSISSFSTRVNSEIKKARKLSGQPMFAYDAGYHAKIYAPFSKIRFRYIGQKPRDYVFGYREIMDRNRKGYRKEGINFKFRDILVITGGEKDVLTLASLGYDAISLNSETSTVLPKDVMELLPNYSRVVVLYDLDDTGIRSTKRLVEKYDMLIDVTLPMSLKEKGGKDVSDFMKFGMDVIQLQNLLRNSLPDDAIQSTSEIEEQRNEIIPAQVYELLPNFLKVITGHFSDPIDRDLVLLSSLAVLSTCFPKVKGIHDMKTVGLNLYLFVSAPPSQGKGVMTWSQSLAGSIDEYLVETFRKEKKKYLAAKNSQKEDKNDTQELEEPQLQRIFIPADASSSAVIEHMSINGDFGIIFETEADTLTKSSKSEWSDFSDILRKAFHHEKVSMSRRMNKEFKQISHPHLSVALSGTPGQIDSFMTSIENGYFSRFLYYYFQRESVWINKFKNNSLNLETLFEGYGRKILETWKEQEEGPIVRLQLTEQQEQKHFDFFDKRYRLLLDLYGDEILASISRHGLVAYRVAMLLTALRTIDGSEKLQDLRYVHDDDFAAALGIIDVMLLHLERVFSRLQGNSKTAGMSPLKKRLFDALPDQFTTAECKLLMKEMGDNQGTADKYLRHLVRDGKLEKAKHGVYRKL